MTPIPNSVRITNDVHLQFAEGFTCRELRPFIYMLSRRLFEGHISVSESEVVQDERVREYFGEVTMPDWARYAEWVGEPEGMPRPFVRTTGGELYLHRYHRYESRIIGRIREMVERGQQQRSGRMAALEAQRDYIRSLGSVAPPANASGTDERVDWQLVGALQCLLHDFFILTGGPGTGKTTTLAKILKVLFRIHPEARVRLAAPTGKAAARMKESLAGSVKDDPADLRERINGLEATTIHRMLGDRSGHVQFVHNRDMPLNHDFIVIDEASMVDMPMMAKLLDAIPPDGRLILLGDRDQLASVEAGSLLGDLFQSVPDVNRFVEAHADWLNGFLASADCRIPDEAIIGAPGGFLSDNMVELRFSHRFHQQGEIGMLARSVIRADQESLEQRFQQKQEKELRFEFGGDSMLEEFAQGYADFIRENDIRKSLERLNQLRILVAVREGKRGLHEVNARVEKFLQSRQLLRPDGGFYENRPVLVTRNINELGIMNGDVGIVRREKGTPKIWFYKDDVKEVRSYLPAYIPALETNFAMTIHKSQGSEYDRVMVILPDEPDHPLLTRELVYTAITRAKKTVFISGSKEVMRNSLLRQVRRNSGVTQRLRQLHIESKPA